MNPTPFRTTPFRTPSFLDQRIEAAGNGAAKMRNWLVAHGAAQGAGFQLLGYHPHHEWYVGCGFAAWDLGER